MSAQDLIDKWEEALERALAEEPLQPEVAIEDLKLTAALPQIRSDLRAGTDSFTCECWGA